MTPADKNIETKAIEALLQTSYNFEVPLHIKPKSTPKAIKLWNKLFPKLKINWKDKRIPKTWKIETRTEAKTENSQTYIRKLQIRPLYLGTIDAIRKQYLKINYDESKLQKEPLLESRKLFNHIDTMIEIAAIATLNTSPQTKNYNKNLKELKHFYKEHLTPASLLQLINLTSYMSNQADFTSSIRLTQITGTTKPKADLVE